MVIELFIDYIYLPYYTSRERYKRIGDIMKKATPFLKLYTEYVKNFQNAYTLVENYEEKSNSFGKLLKEIKVIHFCLRFILSRIEQNQFCFQCHFVIHGLNKPHVNIITAVKTIFVCYIF